VWPDARHVVVVDFAAGGVQLHHEHIVGRRPENTQSWMVDQDLAGVRVEPLRQVHRGPVVEPTGFEAVVGCHRVDCVSGHRGDAGDGVDVAGCFVVECHERSAHDDEDSRLGVLFFEPGSDGAQHEQDRALVEQRFSHGRATGRVRRARCSGL
jgi:hypothetical protein